jgi:hypothetical protein
MAGIIYGNKTTINTITNNIFNILYILYNIIFFVFDINYNNIIIYIK